MKSSTGPSGGIAELPSSSSRLFSISLLSPRRLRDARPLAKDEQNAEKLVDIPLASDVVARSRRRPPPDPDCEESARLMEREYVFVRLVVSDEDRGVAFEALALTCTGSIHMRQQGPLGWVSS
jgi:hypothetical protein